LIAVCLPVLAFILVHLLLAFVPYVLTYLFPNSKLTSNMFKIVESPRF